MYNATSNNDILSDAYQKGDWLISNITVSHDVTVHFRFQCEQMDCHLKVPMSHLVRTRC